MYEISTWEITGLRKFNKKMLTIVKNLVIITILAIHVGISECCLSTTYAARAPVDYMFLLHGE